MKITPSQSSVRAVAALESERASSPHDASSTQRFGGAGTYALLFLTVIYAFNYFDRQLLGLVLPLVKQELSLSDTSLGLISGAAFVLCYSVAGVPIARLADRYSRRDIIAFGFLFWSLATAATAWAGNIWHLAVARLLTGAGEAAGVAPSNAMAADLVPPERRPFALGVLTAGTSLGAIVLFPVAGWIAGSYGWRAAFIVAGVAGVLLALVFFLTVREPARAKAGESPRRFGPTVLFLVRSRTFLTATAAGSLMGVSLYATIVWSSAFLQRVHGLSIAEIGASIGPIRGVTSLAGAILGGWLAARLMQRDMRWSLWVPAIACLAVAPFEILFLYGPELSWALVGYALTGFFSALHLAPVYSAFMLVAEPSMRATVIALFLLVANLVGQIAGPLIVGMLNDRLAMEFGPEAIRVGLLTAVLFAALAGIGFAFAARWLPADAARIERNVSNREEYPCRT